MFRRVIDAATLPELSSEASYLTKAGSRIFSVLPEADVPA
jgi:hypothetical protein